MISIVRVGGEEAKPITIGDGKTVIGRGPFLQVTDKRVSRNHGVLEVSDGKLYLTPTHTNPCFFKKNSSSNVEIMKKDDRRLLENGHIFGLLPDSLYFKVQCPATQNGTNKSNEKNEEVMSEEEEGSQSPEKAKPWQTVKTEDGKEMTLPLEKKRALPAWMIQMAKASPPVSKKPAARQTAKTPTKRKNDDDDDDDYSPAKKKTPSKSGPGRRRKTESEEDEDYDVEEDEEEEKTKTKRGRGSTKKKYYDASDDDLDDDWDAEEEYKPKKRSPAKPRQTPKSKPKPRRKARESSDEESEEEMPKKKRGGKSRKARADSSEDEMPSTSARPTRGARAKRKSYVDDFVEFSDEEDINKGSLSKDEDSDFVLDEGEESASDWEMESKKSSQRKNQGTPSRRSSRTVGRRRKYADSDEDSASDDEYVPRSSRKRQTNNKKRKTGRRKKQSSSEEDESSSDDYVAPKRDPKTKKRKEESESEEEESEEETPKKRVPGKKAKEKEVSESEDDDDNDGDNKKKVKRDKREDVKKVRQLKSKHRPPCMFGKKCYRKNPEHFTEFSHPGDVSYDEQSDLDEEEERKDCPYGNTCYRTNVSHLKQYKHYTRERDAKQVAQLPTGDQGKGDEESTGPNTYDYNDSFINDESQGQSGNEKSASESEGSGSGDEEEDIKQLKKEAKKFVKNEKLTKPV